MTIVAAMILGIASFGHKGVIFPLLVRAIGVLASIISTYSVLAGDKGTAAEAMSSVNRGFVIVRDESGRAVTRRAKIKPGQRLDAEFSDGKQGMRAE